MAQSITGSGNILVAFSELNPDFKNVTVIGLDNPDTVFGGELDDDEITIISSAGAGFIENFTVLANKGDDEVDLYGSTIGVFVDLGEGNDEVNIEDNDDLQTIFGNSTFLGGAGEDYFDAEVSGTNSLFDGGEGEDRFDFENITGITALGGAGEDDFDIPDFTTKSLIDGQDGDDYIEFHGRLASTTMLGGSGNDDFISEYFNYFRNVSVEAGDGNDQFYIDEGNTYNGRIPIKFSTIKLDAGDDDFRTGHDINVSHTSVYGGTGNDNFDIDNTSTLVTKSLVSLGDGDDDFETGATFNAATISGDEGNDYIYDYGSGHTHVDSSVAGGSGNDDILFRFNNNFSKVTISGGAGADDISIAYDAGVSDGSSTITDSFIYGNGDYDEFYIHTDIVNTLVAGGLGDGDINFYGDTFTGLSVTGGDGRDLVTFENTATVSGSDFRTGAADDRIDLRGAVSTSGFYLGAGDDLLDFDATGSLDMVTVNSGTGNDSIKDDSEAVTLTQVSIVSGDGNDDINFSSSNGSTTSANTLSGGAGNDYIEGTITGHTLIIGASGEDTLRSGSGNDTLLAGGGRDTVGGGYGDDLISGGDEIDGLFGDQIATVPGTTGGKDTIYGGTGNDLVFAGLVGEDDEANFIYGDVSTSIVGGNVVETITGVEGADILVGGNNNDTIYAYANTANANTSVPGAGANDTVIGAAGNDTIVGSASGANWLFGDVYATEVPTNATNSQSAFEDINFESNTGVDFYQVNASLALQNDTTSGVNADVPSIFGGKGESIAQTYAINNGLSASISGISELFVPNTSTYSGIPFNYSGILSEVAGDDSIVGGNGGNVIFGGGGNDTITSGSGVDVIIGGEGADSMSGGDGNDLFIQANNVSKLPTAIDQGNAYTFTFNNGVDVITDFKTGTFAAPLDKMAFEGWDGTFINNLGSPLGAVEDDAIIVFSGNYNAGNNTFATTTSAAGDDVLVLLGAADIGIGDLDANISASGNQTAILLGAGKTQSISVSNFI